MVARDGPAVVGMVSLLLLPSTARGGRGAMLEDTVIRPEARGGGAGSRQLQGAVACARAAGCLRLALLTDVDDVQAHAKQTPGARGYRGRLAGGGVPPPLSLRVETEVRLGDGHDAGNCETRG